MGGFAEWWKRQPTRGKVAVGVIAAALFAAPATAAGDSAALSISDAGGGSMRGMLDVEVTDCAPFDAPCSWFAYAVERHAALPCADDTAFLVGVFSSRGAVGSEHFEWIFRPFFPRQERVCIYRGGSSGGLLTEALITLPPGYGRQASSGYNCSDFANQRRAQYYLLLYPADPSGLDGDNDGVACEANSCPCGAEPIPAEPAPPPPVFSPLPAPAWQPPPPQCRRARAAKRGAARVVSKAEWKLEVNLGGKRKAVKYWRKRLKKARRNARRAEKRIRRNCPRSTFRLARHGRGRYAPSA